MNFISNSEEETRNFGKKIGELLRGGEVIELIGDVGSGKTALTKGIALGLGINEYIQSPSFTISRTYKGRDEINLVHYDFYRLDDPGLMANELAESIDNKNNVTVIEWGEIVSNLLPEDRLSINISSMADDARDINFEANGIVGRSILESFEK